MVLPLKVAALNSDGPDHAPQQLYVRRIYSMKIRYIVALASFSLLIVFVMGMPGVLIWAGKKLFGNDIAYWPLLAQAVIGYILTPVLWLSESLDFYSQFFIWQCTVLRVI